MKTLKLLAILFLAASCVPPQQITRLEPCGTNNLFSDHGKNFSWDKKDQVIISVGYSGKINKDQVFEVTIDNQSDSAIFFDPEQSYIFCYDTNAQLISNFLFYSTPPDSVLLDYSEKIDSMNKRVITSSIFSILLGVAYIAADVAIAESNLSPATRDLLAVSHMSGQAIMDASRQYNLEEMDKMSYDRDYVAKEIIRRTRIEPGTFYTGTLHFKVPDSPMYKLYLPLNQRVFSYRFKTIKTATTH